MSTQLVSPSLKSSYLCQTVGNARVGRETGGVGSLCWRNKLSYAVNDATSPRPLRDNSNNLKDGVVVERESFAHAIHPRYARFAALASPRRSREGRASPSPILPLTPFKQCVKAPITCTHILVHLVRQTNMFMSSTIESMGCTCSLARPVTAIHVSPFEIPLCHFLVLTGFQIPSCLFSAIKQRAHRSFWCLSASWEKRHALLFMQCH
jgi:hypothetical protein